MNNTVKSIFDNTPYIDTYINAGVFGEVDALISYEYQEGQIGTESQPEIKPGNVIVRLQVKLTACSDYIDVPVTDFIEDELYKILKEELC